MSKLERALSVRGVKQAFEGSGLRLEFADDLDDTAIDVLQSFGYRVRRFRTDCAAADKNTIGAIAVDDAVTSNSGPAIDAENPHRLMKQLRRVQIPRYRNSRRRAARRHARRGLPSA